MSVPSVDSSPGAIRHGMAGLLCSLYLFCLSVPGLGKDLMLASHAVFLSGATALHASNSAILRIGPSYRVMACGSKRQKRGTCWNSVLRQCEKVVNAEIFEKVPEKPTKVWAGFWNSKDLVRRSVCGLWACRVACGMVVWHL